MAKYDGLIIPRSYNDYINKSDPAGVSQALQLTGVMDAAPTAASTKPAKSGGIFAANAVIMASSATLTGVAISAGSVVRVLFTAALTGSDATTGLTLTYNGNAYAVKVGKNGALEALTAHLIEESYIYLQAYTALELAFDGSQFVVMGNPVVISNADFSIMADGSITYTNTKVANLLQFKPDIYYTDLDVTTDSQGIVELSTANLPIGYYNCQYVLTFFNGTSAGFRYYLQARDYSGNILANRRFTFTLIYIPRILDVEQEFNPY